MLAASGIDMARVSTNAGSAGTPGASKVSMAWDFIAARTLATGTYRGGFSAASTSRSSSGPDAPRARTRVRSTMIPDAPAVVPVGRVASPGEVVLQASRALSDVGGEPAPSLATTVRFASTSEFFIVLFEAAADPPLTVRRGDDEDVFLDECVELFLASPLEPRAYREIVVNPRGSCYIAHVENPDESRETWKLSRGHASAAISIAVRGEPAARPAAEWRRWSCRLAVPWANLPSGLPPAEGEGRRGNAYRIARGRTTRHLALSPTLRSSPPDFHVPSRFARFVF